MVISIPGHDVFDSSKLLDGVFGILAEGGRSDNPDMMTIMFITGGELDSGRTTAHLEPSEEPGKWFREGNDIGRELYRGLGGLHAVSSGPERTQHQRNRYLANDNVGIFCEIRYLANENFRIFCENRCLGSDGVGHLCGSERE